MFLVQLLKYLFKGPRLKQRLPLLPLSASSDECRMGIDEEREAELALLVQAGVAKTEADAMRLLLKHPSETVGSVAKEEKRQRRYKNRWLLAGHRAGRLW